MGKLAYRVLLGCVWALGAGSSVAQSDAGVVAQDATSGVAAENAQPIPVDSVTPAMPPQGGTPTALGKTGIGEIIVTAQKRAENLQDVPISITALSKDDIQERSISSINDIANQTPGLQFGDVVGASQISLRGVGLSLISGAGENSVAIHTDGLYLPQPGAINLTYEDLGSVEVLRGPQGTLYGRNATAGVINLISTPPPDHLDVGAEAQYGAYDQRRLKLHAGDSFLDDHVRVRLTGVKDETRDDYFKNLADPDKGQGASDLETLRLNVDADPGGTLKLQLRAFTADQNFNGVHIEAYKPPPGALLAPPGTYTKNPYTHLNNDAGKAEKTLDGGSLRGTLALGDDWTLSSISGITRFRFGVDHYDSDGTSNKILTATRDIRDRTFTQELLLQTDQEWLQWTTGLYYLRERYEPVLQAPFNVAGIANSGVDATMLANLPGLGPILGNLVDEFLAGAIGDTATVEIRNHDHEKTASKAAFTDVTVSAFDIWRMYAGLRYSEDRKSQRISVSIVEGQTGEGVVQCADRRNKRRDAAWTGRIGTQVDVGDDAMMYAQYSRGFKSGGFGITNCEDPFEPETLGAYEVGIKSTLFDGTLRVNGAAFHYDYRDLQVEEVVVPNSFINNAQAKVDGAELEVVYKPVPRLELSANASWLDAVYTRYRNADGSQIAGAIGVAPEQDLSGNRLNRSPEWTLVGAVQVDQAIAKWGRLSLRGDATWQDDYYLREFNTGTDRQRAHTLYNAFLSYYTPGETLAIRAFGKNLTDEPVLAGFVGILGYKTAMYNPPRLWGLCVEYRYGR